MAEKNNTSGESEHRPPDISFKYASSIFEVYNLETIRAERDGRLYDRSDFGGNIERVTVDEEKIDTNGEAGVALTLTVTFDKFKDQENWMSGIFRSLDTTYSSKNRDYEGRRHELFPKNVLFLTTSNGMRVLAFFDINKKALVVSNHLTLTASGKTNSTEGQRFGIVPIPLESMDGVTQLSSFGKIMIRVLDAAATEPFHSPIMLQRTYKLGERITNTRPSTANAVGGKAVEGARTQETEPTSQLSGIESFSDIILVSDERVVLADIGGLESVKRDLMDVALSFRQQEIMAKWGAKRPQGVLLYGEPGTGKTMLAEALATEIEARLVKVQSSDIYQKWLGDSETRIKDFFSVLKKLKEPTVVLFDEIDAIVGITAEPSAGGADNARNSVAGIFKQEMNDLAKLNPNVLIVATTNHVDRLDPSLIRSGRFDHHIYVPMPDAPGRQQIISGIIARRIMTQESTDFRIFSDDIDMPEIVGKTDGMSGADIAEIFRRISFTKAMQEARGNAVEPISQSDMLKTIDSFRKETI